MRIPFFGDSSDTCHVYSAAVDAADDLRMPLPPPHSTQVAIVA